MDLTTEEGCKSQRKVRELIKNSLKQLKFFFLFRFARFDAKVKIRQGTERAQRLCKLDSLE